MPEIKTKPKTIHQKFLQFQMEIETLKKDKKNPFYDSKYLDINGILGAVKPRLNELGLFLTQGLTTIDSNGKLGMATTIFDADSGEHLGFVCPLPDTPDAQKAGSAITYFRRYALVAMLGLEAEDDDANAAIAKTAKPVKSVTPSKPLPDLDKKTANNNPPFGPGSDDEDPLAGII